jgi:hypothetical protein
MKTEKRLLLSIAIILFVASMITFLVFDTNNAIKVLLVLVLINWWHEAIKKIWDGE